MESINQKDSEERTRGDGSPASQPPGQGVRIIMEYLFPDLPFDSSSSGETIAALSDEEGNAVVNMVHLFLQARYEEASVEAERCIKSQHPEIRDFALLAHAVTNVAQHNIEGAMKDFQVLQQKWQHPENKRAAALNDLYRFVLSVFFHLGEDIDPMPLESVPYCSEGSQLYALYARSYSLYLQQEYAQALGVADAGCQSSSAHRHLPEFGGFHGGYQFIPF